MIKENENTKINEIKLNSPQEMKLLFLKGMEIIFKNWTALRMSIDSNGGKIYNNIKELLNEKDEIIEELEFNIIIGSLYENICTILVSLILIFLNLLDKRKIKEFSRKGNLGYVKRIFQ